MTNEELKDAAASFDSGELEELTARVRSVLDIRDRKYGITAKSYPKCFVGSEAVEKLVDEGIAGDAADAVRIGNMMLNASVFHHVLDAHPFENKNLFYRFTVDEDHGMTARSPDGRAVSWADFIAPLDAMEDRNFTLQPAIPERDPELASFAQVDPEVAHVGLYEKDLHERNTEFATFTREFSDVDRGIVDGETEGFVKIHVKKGTDQILGATIVGSHAGDMISEITVAMQSGMGLGKMANVIHPYPTAAEAIRQCGDAYNRSRLTPTVKAIFRRLMTLRR